jgi:hypothetical protein
MRIISALLVIIGLAVATGCGVARPSHAKAQGSTTTTSRGKTTSSVPAASHDPNEKLDLHRAKNGVVRGFGLSLSLPQDWSGQVYKRVAPALAYGAILDAANFSLPYPDGYDADAGVSAEMNAHQVLIVLTEHSPKEGGSFRELKTLTVEPGDVRLEGTPDGHATAFRRFSISGRHFDVYVQWGTDPAPAGLVRAADDVLASLRVHAR